MCSLRRTQCGIEEPRGLRWALNFSREAGDLKEGAVQRTNIPFSLQPSLIFFVRHEGPGLVQPCPQQSRIESGPPKCWKPASRLCPTPNVIKMGPPRKERGVPILKGTGTNKCGPFSLAQGHLVSTFSPEIISSSNSFQFLFDLLI